MNEAPIRLFRSKRQEMIYDFIIQYRKDTGMNPSIREIGNAAKITSTSVVTYNVNQLIDAGLLRRVGKKTNRNLVPCDDDELPFVSPETVAARYERQKAEQVVSAAREVIAAMEKEGCYCIEMFTLKEAIAQFEDLTSKSQAVDPEIIRHE